MSKIRKYLDLIFKISNFTIIKLEILKNKSKYFLNFVIINIYLIVILSYQTCKNGTPCINKTWTE